MSRQNSLRSSNRDSFHSAGSAAALDEVRRRSLLREQRISETLDREINTKEDKDKPGMAPPVYRLYPHHTASGRREMRARESRSPGTQKDNDRSEGVDLSSYLPAEPTLHDSQLSSDEPRPAVKDFQHPTTTGPVSRFSRPQSPVNAALTKSSIMSQTLSELSGSDVDNSLLASQLPGGQQKRSSLQIPSRTSSKNHDRNASLNQIGSTQNHSPRRPPQPLVEDYTSQPISEPGTPETMNGQYGPGDRSSRESAYSHDTAATSINNLPALQTKGPDNSDAQQLEPLAEDDPRSFDLVEPASVSATRQGLYTIEKQADLLLSDDHLNAIFGDSKLLLRFTGFLNSHRPQSIPLLIYYLDALKAIRAIKYANAIAEALEPLSGCDFTKSIAQPTGNITLEDKANRAFELLVKEDLPAYIAYTWIQVVSVSIQRRINGTLAPHLREASEGLAEVFCLSDPSRPDNPIVFASEEFARTTQYGMTYAIGRNCRFLQGPRTSKDSVRRLAEACRAGRETTEVFVNYRRDGSPFMNLLMIAPLMDSRGELRYFIGAQVDVSGLLKTSSELPGLEQLVEKQQGRGEQAGDGHSKRDEFQELAEMFNGAELESVRKHGGRMHKEYVDDDDDAQSMHSGHRPRLMLNDPTQDVLDRQRDEVRSSVPAAVKERANGKLAGVYQHYLLVRPAPSLRILFTSPSLRVPGILQSPFLHRIGGSPRVRSDLAGALGEGRGVTAKVRWLAKADTDGEGEGRPRWIHCTPLLGHSGSVGVWMIVLVDEEGSRENISANRRFRPAPPVASNVNIHNKERRTLNAYDVDTQRRGGGYAENYAPVPYSSDPTPPRKTSDASISTSNAGPSFAIPGFSLANGRPQGREPQSPTPTGSRNASATRKTAHFNPDNHIAGQYNRPVRPESIRTDTGRSQATTFDIR